ncbi:PREDICTED: G-protein coupled receptor 98-like isoform X1 [Amphimedon queenslandica]|nr:PREDICTED: G-protein coupled receptor 98-like isoform X1 [Amphimedon queenslandica]|eukprot:XP_019849167.1 PREDICTED: G-protein coupled receptor 98-like isoform X1 [Amphimedon queenslandica]
MAPLGLLIFAFSAFLFRGVESQPMSCFVQNPCTGTPETTTHEDCCSLERLSGIPENCGERADDACNIYYRVSGEPCDPCQIIGFENSTITLTESGPQTIPIKLFSLGLIEIILLTASITSTNATENVDYSFTSQMFDYLRRVPSDTDIDIDIINDNIALEPIEVIDITLINRGFIDIFGPHDTTIIIIDEDVLTIAANPSFFEVQEGGSISFTLSKDKETAVPVDITVTPLTYRQYSNKTATNNNLPSLSSITNAPSNPAEEQDFNSTAIQLRTGNSSGSFPVSMNGLVTDDTIVEDPEGFVLLIESTNPDPRIRFNNQIIVIQINNDDTLSLMFDQSTLRLSENGGSLSLSILPQAGVMSELTNTVINYQVTPSLAGDVTFLPANSLVFDGTSAVLRITPIDDQTLEDIKTAIITFQPASNESGIQFSPTNSVNVIITDDENVTLSLISDSTFVSEGSSFNVCVSVTEPNDVAPHFIPVSLTLIPYLPTQEGDYSTMDSNLSPILTQRNRSTCFLIDTDEDQMTEEDEMFGVSIALQSVAEADFFRSRTSFNPPVLNLTIINDDSVTIGFTMESISVVEGSNPVSICFRVNEGILARNVAVNVSSSSNTAVIGVDYSLPSSVFIFNSSVNEHCVSFVPLEDDIIENTETVTVLLSTSDPAVNFDISRETVSITDNDRASIDFSQAEFTIREDGSTLSYSVILTGNLDRSIVVSVNDIPGTATRDVDYSNVSETITFTNSSKRFTGVLRIINDSIVETTETLILALSSSDQFVDLVNATVSIADVSNVSIGFTMESISVEEVSNPVSICVRVNEGILARNVAVNVSSSSNTAVIGVDYSLPSSVFIFNSSVNEHCVSFVPLEDDIIENTETVAVLLSTSDPAVNFDISRENVNIRDNDRASIGFSQASFIASEDGSTLSYSVILTGNLDRSIVVSVNDIPGTATRDVDYSNVSETITFTNSSKRFTGVLRIINDSIVETTETLILALSSSDRFVDLVNATVSIADSATSRVNFGFPVLSIPVNESDQTLVVCVDRFSGQIESPREVIVLLSTVDGTARGGSDYISISMVQLVFNSTVMSKCADINIRQDSLYEIDEYFNAIISSNDVAVHFINNVSTIIIQDNDMLAIATSLPSNTINVLESNGTVQFCFNVSSGAIDSTSTAVTIDVTATSLGATEGVDYSAMNRSFTFVSDSMTHCYSFNVTDDQNVENEERFQLALSSSSPRVTAPTITVNIIDDDGITLNFESVPPVSEEAQFVTVCVRAQNSQFLQRSVEVLLNTIEGSAAELNDFLPLNNVPLTISPEIGVNCTNITLQGDDGVEGTETFSVRMSSTSNSVSFGDDLRIQLIDDDVATVRLIGPTDAVSEGGGSFDARVEVIGKLEIPITLSLSTLDGTALAGEDFNGVVNASIMLSGTSSSQNVPITIREDDLVEGEESFTISLSLRPVEGANINLSPGTVAVMISDNDDVTIGFLMTSLSVEEGSSPVSICFRVNEGILARNVAVNVSSSSNTAVIGVDYNLPSSVFIFNSSVNEHCVSFVPLEDDIIENTETVTVLLSTSDPAVNFDISRETVSITDNDRASIGFSQASFIASEDGSTLSYSVILTGNLDRSIVVSVNDIPGTATR